MVHINGAQTIQERGGVWDVIDVLSIYFVKFEAEEEEVYQSRKEKRLNEPQLLQF